MHRSRTVETARDRVGLVHEAGLSRVSLLSVLAGVLVAYGAFAILGALFGGIAAASGGNFEIPQGNWDTAGIVGAAVLGLTLLCAYLFGSYVAGRMARRSGVMHGLLVFVLGFAVAIGVGALATAIAGTDSFRDGLRSVGIPNSGEDLQTMASVGGLVALASMFLGSLLGGALGDRWHGKLLTRALDPTVGPTAERTEDREDPSAGSVDDGRQIDLRDTPRTSSDDTALDMNRDDYVRATIGPLYDSERDSRIGQDRPMNEAQRIAATGNRNREIERFDPTKPF